MKKLIPILLLAALLMTGCSPKTEEPEPTAAPASTTPSPTPTPTPTPEPVYYNGLTGEKLSEKPENLRPYAVMINNISVAQPHCGVSKADIIYEVLAEGEITRMLAIFSDISDAGPIGSMRSSRPYYIQLALAYDAIYVHAGGSDQAYEDIAALGVNNIDGVRGAYTAEVFYRDPSRQSHGIEHSMFTTPEKVIEYTSVLGYEAKHASENYDYGLSFAEAPEFDGEAASSINVSFSGLKNTDLTYSGGLYSARQFGNDYIDGNTGETVKFRNVLVLYADTQILDDYGRRAVNLNGTGSGLFFCDGKVAEISWSHDGTGTPFRYFMNNGVPLTLGTGTSYIAIVPTGSTISYQ